MKYNVNARPGSPDNPSTRVGPLGSLSEAPPLVVSNDPTAIEHEGDEHVVRQMHYAGAKALERATLEIARWVLAAGAGERQEVTVEEVIGFMRELADELRRGA